MSRQTRTLFYLFSYDLVLLVGQLLLGYHGLNTLWTWNVSTLVEFIVIASVFVTWTQAETLKLAMKRSIGVVVTFWIIGKFSFEPLTEIPTYTSPVESAVLIAMSTYLVILLVRTDPNNMFRLDKFWILIGIMIYNAGTIPFIVAVYRILALPIEKISDFWSINWGLSIIENLLVSVGFLCRDKRFEEETSQMKIS